MASDGTPHREIRGVCLLYGSEFVTAECHEPSIQ